MQCRGGEYHDRNREIELRTAPWQAPWVYDGIRQPKHAQWLAGVVDGYLCGAAPDLMEHDLVEVFDALVVPDGCRPLLLLVRQRRWRRGQHVVLPPDRAIGSTARRGRAEQSRAVELEGGRGRGSGERQAGRWASSRLICGIFGQCPCACVLFSERADEGMRMSRIQTGRTSQLLIM
jgi:hypothetical protein